MNLNTYNEMKQAIGRQDQECLRSLLEGASKEDASSYVSKECIFDIPLPHRLLEIAISDDNIEAIKAMAPYHDKENFCNPIRSAFEGYNFLYLDDDTKIELIRELIPLTDWERQEVGRNVLWHVSRGYLGENLEFVRELEPLVKDKSWALYEASHRGNLELVRELLPHFERPIEYFENEDGYLSHPLSVAAKCGHLDIVRELIPYSDPQAHDSQALQNASMKGHLEVVRELIPHSEPKAEESGALFLAIFFNHPECMKELLPHSSIVSWQNNNCGYNYWININPDMREYLQTYYERQALNQALPVAQAQQQAQTISQGRSRGRL